LHHHPAVEDVLLLIPLVTGYDLGLLHYRAQENSIRFHEGVSFHIPVGVRKATVDDTLGMTVVVRKEPHSVKHADPAVAWSLPGIVRHKHAAHRRVD